MLHGSITVPYSYMYMSMEYKACVYFQLLLYVQYMLVDDCNTLIVLFSITIYFSLL